MRPILLGLSVVVVFFLLAGCGGGGGPSVDNTVSEVTTPSTAETTVGSTGGGVAEVELAPIDGSGASGTAAFTDVAQGIRVDLELRGLPDPNARYLAHIHAGTCADDQGGEEHDGDHEDEHADHHEGADHDEGALAEIEYPLPPITSDPEGMGTTSTVLERVTVEELFSGSPKYVNVHAEGSGNPPAIACSPLVG
jgi:Cu/Zn superoxide dismutase